MVTGIALTENEGCVDTEQWHEAHILEWRDIRFSLKRLKVWEEAEKLLADFPLILSYYPHYALDYYAV